MSIFRQIRALVSAEEDSCSRAKVLATTLAQTGHTLIDLASYAQAHQLDFPISGSSVEVPVTAEAYLYEVADKGLTSDKVHALLNEHNLFTSQLIGWDVLLKAALFEVEVFETGEEYFVPNNPQKLARHLNLWRIFFPGQIDESLVCRLSRRVVDEYDTFMVSDEEIRRTSIWGKPLSRWAEGH